MSNGCGSVISIDSSSRIGTCMPIFEVGRIDFLFPGDLSPLESSKTLLAFDEIDTGWMPARTRRRDAVTIKMLSSV